MEPTHPDRPYAFTRDRDRVAHQDPGWMRGDDVSSYAQGASGTGGVSEVSEEDDDGDNDDGGGGGGGGGGRRAVVVARYPVDPMMPPPLQYLNPPYPSDTNYRGRDPRSVAMWWVIVVIVAAAILTLGMVKLFQVGL